MKNAAAAWYFDGDFDFLAVRAHFLYGSVPINPTYSDFAMAVTRVEGDREEAAAHWFLEAVRERRLNQGAPLAGENLRSINTRTAERLYRALYSEAQ